MFGSHSCRGVVAPLDNLRACSCCGPTQAVQLAGVCDYLASPQSVSVSPTKHSKPCASSCGLQHTFPRVSFYWNLNSCLAMPMHCTSNSTAIISGSAVPRGEHVCRLWSMRLAVVSRTGPNHNVEDLKHFQSAGMSSAGRLAGYLHSSSRRCVLSAARFCTTSCHKVARKKPCFRVGSRQPVCIG